MRAPSRECALCVATALALAGCDAFDFGRVTGTAGSAAASAAPAPAGPIASAEQTAAPKKASRVVIVLGGEIDLGGLAKTSATGDKTYDPLAELAPVLEGSQAVFASLVSPITDRKTQKGAVPAAPLSGAVALHRAHVVLDATSAALFSSGTEAFQETLVRLQQEDVRVAGASVSVPAPAPPRIPVGDATVAFVVGGRVPQSSPLSPAFHAHVLDAAHVAEMVRGARPGNDFVVASVGGGAEYVEAPSAEDVALARAAVDAGADVVTIHGAKMPLGVAFVSGHPVLYGLGNLVADENPKSPWSARGFLAKVTLGSAEKPTLDLCPFLLVNGNPRLLSGPSRATQEGIFTRALSRLSAPLGSVSIGEPDLHSCLRVAEATAPAVPTAAPP